MVYMWMHVRIDNNHPVFEAYVDVDDTWNGFMIPYFTFSEAKRVLDYYKMDTNDDIDDGIVVIGDNEDELSYTISQVGHHQVFVIRENGETRVVHPRNFEDCIGHLYCITDGWTWFIA